jgi:putative glutamine amidotransferase
MKKPFIGVTSDTCAFDRHASQPQDRLNQSYSQALMQAGAVPVILPNLTEDAEMVTQTLARLDGLLLSGGWDISPTRYGESPLNETVKVDEKRDQAEFAFLYAALERGMPLLAICRGIQALNVARGGTLYQDIPTQIATPLQHQQTQPRYIPTHTVAVEPDSRLAQIVGATCIQTNSMHHQAVREIGEGLRVTARAEDGVIEALEVPQHRFVVAVQFHPEELALSSDNNESALASRALFRAFIEACR